MEILLAALAGAIAGVLSSAAATRWGWHMSDERARAQLQWLADRVTNPLWLWWHSRHQAPPSVWQGENGWTWWACGYPCHKWHIRTYGARTQTTEAS